MASGAIVQAFDGLYEAAVTPEGWPDALHRFALATGSVGCRLRPVHSAPRDVSFPESPDIAGFLNDFVSEGWQRSDPRTLRGAPLAELGRSIVLEHDIATDEERRHSPFYQTLLRRHDLPWWAAIAFAVDGRRWCVSILRSAAQGAFTPDEAQGLADAAPTLRSIVSLGGKLTLSHARSAVEALEQVGCAALVLDRRGRCVLMNALAQSAVGGDLRLTDKRLHAIDRDSDQRLQRLIDCGVAARTADSPAPAPCSSDGAKAGRTWSRRCPRWVRCATSFSGSPPCWSSPTSTRALRRPTDRSATPSG